MTHPRHISFLQEIEAFLSKTGLGPSYFGKISCGNSELVHRLRAGRRVWPETEEKVREFMAEYSPSQPA